ncbi:MAG: YidC/Oxa1 family membrane protein insertase [Bacilli bacterium]|nr:YidC/Oxa1 family membrane protein insertase [Bacilli bacterium]
MNQQKKIFLAIALIIGLALVLTGCSSADATTRPITGFVFEDLFVYPMAGLMWVTAKTIAFGNYGIVIVLSTIIVRTLAWPIYAKTNDMSLKMSLVQPEADRIRAKYEGKEDEQSKQRMAMETQQLYKKYGIGLGGCLLPLVQFPIFVGFYRTISRMPATILDTEGNLLTSGHWLAVFNSVKIFGVNLLEGQTDNPTQKIAVIVLAVLVGITQILSLFISQHRQKKARADQQASVPSYRRQQTDTQKQTEKTMNIMMYAMTIMMVVFVLQSPAGLGLYWLVGNLYSTLQSYIGYKNSQKRLEVLKKKF